MSHRKTPLLNVFPLFLFVSLLSFVACSPAEESAEEAAGSPVLTQEFRYAVDGQEHLGYIAWDTTIQDPRPGILVVHEWWGHNDYSRKRAEMLAEEGYTAFALDMFGEGQTADHPDEAMAFVQQSIENWEKSQSRFVEALNLLKRHPTVDSQRVGAIGYCFGGAVVLSMARAEVGLDAVVSFHGSLGSEIMADSTMETSILVCTGAADPMIPAEAIEAFRQEMEAADADYEVIVYPDAMHSFTNPAADSVGKQFEMPLAYNAAADTASWQSATAFLANNLDK